MIILPRPSTGSWFWRPISRSMQNVWTRREHRGIVQPWSQVRRSADQYLEQMPASQYPRVVNSAAWELSKINTSSDETANRRMLGSILAGHKPTYVHSLMVAELTRALLHRQIETRPENTGGPAGLQERGRSAGPAGRALPDGL